MTTFDHNYRVVKPGTYTHNEKPNVYFEDTSNTKQVINTYLKHYSNLDVLDFDPTYRSNITVDQFGTLLVGGNAVINKKSGTLVPTSKYPLYKAIQLGLFNENLSCTVNDYPDINATVKHDRIQYIKNIGQIRVFGTKVLTNLVFEGSGHIDYENPNIKNDLPTTVNSIVNYLSGISVINNNTRYFNGELLYSVKGDKGCYQITGNNTNIANIYQWVGWSTHTSAKNPLYYASNDLAAQKYKHLCLGRSYFRMPIGTIYFGSTNGRIIISRVYSYLGMKQAEVYNHLPYNTSVNPAFNSANNNYIRSTDLLPKNDNIAVEFNSTQTSTVSHKAPDRLAGRCFINVFSTLSEVIVTSSDYAKTYRYNTIDLTDYLVNGLLYVHDPNKDVDTVNVALAPDDNYFENVLPQYPYEDCAFVHKPRLEFKASFRNKETYPLVLGRFNPDHLGYFGTMHESVNRGILVANMPSNYINERTWSYYKMIERPWLVDSNDLKSKGKLSHYTMMDGVVWCGPTQDITVMGNVFKLRTGTVVYDSSCYPIECRGDRPYPKPSNRIYLDKNYIPDKDGNRIMSPRLTYCDAYHYTKINYRKPEWISTHFKAIIPINNGTIINGVVNGDVLIYYPSISRFGKYYLIPNGTKLVVKQIDGTDEHDYMNYFVLPDTVNINTLTPISGINEKMHKQLERHHFPLRAKSPHHNFIRYDASQNRIWIKIVNNKVVDPEVRYMFTTNVDRIEYTTDVYPFLFNESTTNDSTITLANNSLFTVYTLDKRMTFKVTATTDKITVPYPMDILKLLSTPNISRVPYTEYGNRPKGVSKEMEFMGRKLEYVPQTIAPRSLGIRLQYNYAEKDLLPRGAVWNKVTTTYQLLGKDLNEPWPNGNVAEFKDQVMYIDDKPGYIARISIKRNVYLNDPVYTNLSTSQRIFFTLVKPWPEYEQELRDLGYRKLSEDFNPVLFGSRGRDNLRNIITTKWPHAPDINDHYYIPVMSENPSISPLSMGVVEYGAERVVKHEYGINNFFNIIENQVDSQAHPFTARFIHNSSKHNKTQWWMITLAMGSFGTGKMHHVFHLNWGIGRHVEPTPMPVVDIPE